MDAHFTLAVEGDVDEAVARRMVSAVGGEAAAVFGRRGKGPLLSSLHGFNASALHTPWLVLVDLDSQPCPVEYAHQILAAPSPKMCRRVVVREVEAWLLADREGFSRWAGISIGAMPADVETIADPKRRLVELIRRGRKRGLQADVLPRPGSGREVGAGYNSRIKEFVEAEWDIEAASLTADSLRRAMDGLRKVREIVLAE